jgi:hypothetical protein
MRIAAFCLLAGCALIAFSSCAAKTDGPDEVARGEVENGDPQEIAKLKDLLAAKIEVVRLTEFPGDLELEKKLRPQDHNQEVRISGARSGGVSDSQRRALDEFVAQEKKIFRAVREAIYRNYRENYLPHRDQLRSMLTGTARINGLPPESIESGMRGLPELKTGNELDHLVALIAIYVHRPVKGVSKIGIQFQCPWEPDEGLGVRIAGSAVEAIGTADVALSD